MRAHSSVFRMGVAALMQWNNTPSENESIRLNILLDPETQPTISKLIKALISMNTVSYFSSSCVPPPPTSSFSFHTLSFLKTYFVAVTYIFLKNASDQWFLHLNYYGRKKMRKTMAQTNKLPVVVTAFYSLQACDPYRMCAASRQRSAEQQRSVPAHSVLSFTVFIVSSLPRSPVLPPTPFAFTRPFTFCPRPHGLCRSFAYLFIYFLTPPSTS